MSIRIVRLGSTRAEDEGLRIGTVRRPPRGVPKNEYSARDIYDVWLPLLAPSEELLKEIRSKAIDESSWKRFKRQYLKEMKAPEPSRVLDMLAALSHQTNFAVGCYCDDEARCHRSLLRELLVQRDAEITG
jgi:uncharacterized protein YeaO (DUF488 family)